MLCVEARPVATEWPDLAPVLGGIRWAVVGAVATRLYMPERATIDLDIAVEAVDLQAAEERLRSAGFRARGSLAIGGSAWWSRDNRMVDLIELKQPWARLALREAQESRGVDFPVLGLPFLILMKLESGRSQDIADVTRMLGYAKDEQLEQTREVIAEYQPGMAADLESFIVLGRLEIAGQT